MHLELTLTVALLTMPMIYVVARIVSVAYFHAKFDYQRKLLRNIDKGVV